MEEYKVSSVDFKQLYNEEVFECMDSVNDVVAENPNLSAVQADLERFFETFRVYREVMEPIRQRQFTPELKVLDKGRDTSYSGMHTVVLGFKDSPISEDKNAATMLNNVFVKYKGLQQLNHKKETGSLKNFCEELDGPYHEYVETLHLSEWFEALKQMNADFEDLYEHRRTENDAVVNSQEVKAAREALVSAFRDLASDLETMVRVSDDPESYRQVISAINSILNDWKQTLNRRKGQKNANKADNPTTPSTPENNGGENNGENGEGGDNSGDTGDNTPSADA